MALEKNYGYTKQEMLEIELSEQASETISFMTIAELIQWAEDRNIDYETFDDESEFREAMEDKLFYELVKEAEGFYYERDYDEF